MYVLLVFCVIIFNCIEIEDFARVIMFEFHGYIRAEVTIFLFIYIFLHIYVPLKNKGK